MASYVADIPEEERHFIEERPHIIKKPHIINSNSADFIAGWAGGCAGLMFGHPFDTIKVCQQTSTGRNVTIMSCVRSTMLNEGVRGFFKGMAFPLAAVGFLNSVFFGVYGNILARLPPDDATAAKTDSGQPRITSLRNILIAGALAGSVQGIFACPIELVKVKLQAQNISGSAVKYAGPIECAQSIYRDHGVKGCFRGLTATIIRELPGFSVYITTYEILCQFMTPLGQSYPSMSSTLLAGGLAGTLSWSINIPMDIVKSRMQVDDLSRPRYSSSWDCAVKSYRSEGLKVFWRGLPIACMRAFPNNAVTFAIYSYTLRFFKQRMELESDY